MQTKKNLNIVLVTCLLLTLMSPIKAKATEECFESASRAIFKFNMALDNIILEPLAKGYNKLPSPVRSGTSNFT